MSSPVGAAAGELAGAERDIARAAGIVRRSVVTVTTPKKNDYDLTGVVISSRGVVLTLRRPLLAFPRARWVRRAASAW